MRPHPSDRHAQAEVRPEIAQLTALKRQLLGLKERNDACLDGTATEWSCAVGLDTGRDWR